MIANELSLRDLQSLCCVNGITFDETFWSNKVIGLVPQENESLKELYYRVCSIAKLQSFHPNLDLSLDKLANLQYLQFIGCGLEKIPDEIGLLRNVKILVLYDNLLTEIPESIGKLPLFSLDLGRNRLQKFPSVICELTELVLLYLDYNEIRWIPEELAGLTSLKLLELEHNNVLYLPESVAEMTLEKLSLLNNPLRILPVCNNVKDLLIE